jgi:8-oxo-dGTP diphosphatase
MEAKTILKKNINADLEQIHDLFKIGISVDLVIFGYDQNDLKVLLIKCNMPDYEGMWSLVGDLVRPAEDLDDAAYRVLHERTAMDDIYLEQVQTFGEVGRHPAGRVVTTAYFSLVKIKDHNLEDPQGNELSWHSIKDLDQLAFDHSKILKQCLQKMRKRIKEIPLAFNLLPYYFTLSELQKLYEVLLGHTLDKRNFRKKIMGMNILEETNKIQENVAHRPAKLYRFKSV